MALCSPGAGGCARPGRKCLFTACFLIEDMPGPRASAGFYTGDLRSLPVFQTQRTVFKERDECEVLWAYSRAVPSPVAALLFIYPFVHSWGGEGEAETGDLPQLGLCPPFSSGFDSACPEDQATPGKVFRPGILLE